MLGAAVKLEETPFFKGLATVTDGNTETNDVGIDKILLEKVEVVPEERKWILHLSSTCPVPEEVKQQLRDILEKQLDHGIQVDIRITLSLDMDLDLLCREYWEEIIHDIHAKVPSLKVWLSTSIRYEVAGNRLTFFVPNLMAMEYCKIKQDSIEACFRQKYNQEIKITWEIEDVPSEEETFFDSEKEEQRCLEEIFAHKPAEKKEIKQNSVLLGKEIKAVTHRIADITDEEKQVIIEGEICESEIRVLKSGRQLLSFGVTDKTNSIGCKLFFDEGQTPLEMTIGDAVRVRGPVQFDRYTTELTLMPKDLMRVLKTVRPDEAEEKRVELHLHTKLSEMDGVSTVQNIIKRAGEWGHPAIAITDHGVVQAFPDAAEAGKKYGIKVILGMEGYLVEDEGKSAAEINRSKSYHIVILAKNYIGLKNLYKLVTLSHMEHYYRRPRIPRSLLSAHREGLILGTACESGELMRAIIQKQDNETLEKIASFYDYLEIQPIGNNQFLINSGEAKNEDELRDFNREIVELGKKLSIPVAATCDVHFLDKEDEVYRRILMAGKGFADADNQAPLYLRTTQEMLAEFTYLNEEDAYRAVVTVPRMIADQVEEIKPFPDDFFEPKIDGAPEKIRDMAVTRAYELYGDPLPEIVQKTLKKELDSIIGNGFAVLYLIAHLLVKRSNEDGYLVGSRGSVGSSLVATFTGITEVNPLPPHYRCVSPDCFYSEFVTDGSVGSGVDLPDKRCPRCGLALLKDGHDIPFETFLGFKGDKVPDIDLNFSGEYQPRAMKYTEEIFGKENVFRAGTISTIAEKTAFGFVKNYLEERKFKYNQTELNRLVSGCSGVKRTTGQHPGGLMVIPKECDVFDFTPLQRPANDTSSDIITTHFDYHSISGRLVKLDLLGHDDPTSIKMLEDLTGVDAKKIRLDDQQTLSLFSGTEALGVTSEEIGSNTGTLGIPEFGTKFVRQMLEDTRPSSFSHLVRISGLSHGTNVWVGNAQDLVLNGTADISNIIACRDDIMIYLIQKGMDPSHAFKIMEQVRKGKGLKPEDIDAMKAQNVPNWHIDSCQKISYMFPKAHAAAYVTMAFRIAWFKINYPEAFYATFYTVRADEFDAELICGGVGKCREMIKEINSKGNSATAKDKNMQTILELAVEMYCRGINLRKVDLWESDVDRFLITPEGLLPPLSSLQGVGDTAAGVLAKLRDKGRIKSIEDLQAKSQGKVSKTVIEALQKHGCLEGIPEKNQLSLF